MKKNLAKRILSTALVCLMVSILAGSFAGCGNSGSSGSSGSGGDTADKKFDTLNVGVLVSTVGIPALYADEQGWFDEAGLDVNLIIFPTGAPVNEAIAAKQIDVACSGFASVYSLANANCSWIAEINTTGGMGIYARPDSPIAKATGNVPGAPAILGSAETVKGAKILGPLGTSSQFAAISYIDQLGLSETDVEQVHMEYGPGFQAFVAGEGDLISISPPYSYDCLDKGYVEVASFEDATNVLMKDGCFARNDVIEKRSEEVELFLKVLVRAMDALGDDQVRFDYTINKYHENAQEFTEENMQKEIADRSYVNTVFMSDPTYVFGAAMAPISEFLAKQGKISEDNLPNVQKSFNASLLEKATGLDIKVYSE
ncbi:MAG: hypothetical protein K0R19_1088 [Bacillota bacterium]|jgi:ABC-type nitrate/sulfonate/bicarbonate transport system substrate-binding protein|nr:hypothetical protein [Bacillota bacterium]